MIPDPAGLFRLDGRRALITGSTAGIGLTLAYGMAQFGAHVLINGRDAERAERTAAQLREAGLAASAASFDVTDHAAARAAVDGLEADSGPIDILVNNAGIQRRAPLQDFALADWEALIATNLSSVFHVTQAAARHMIGRGRGKVVNICSVQSQLGRPSIAPYTATKGAVAMLTKGMCAEWARHGIQANGLAPGYFATDMNAALVANGEFSDWLCRRTPAGRWGRTEELIGAAVFLASEASNFVNGQILYVDGGLTSTV